MYDKLDVVAHDYNLWSGRVMLGRLPELDSQWIYLTPEAVVCPPYVRTQICVSITTHKCTHTHLNMPTHVHTNCMEISVTVWRKPTLQVGLENVLYYIYWHLYLYIFIESSRWYIVAGMRSLDTQIRKESFFFKKKKKAKSSWLSKIQEVSHWKAVWSQDISHQCLMFFDAMTKIWVKSVTNSTTWDHAASGTTLIWMAMVMSWPKLGPSSMSGCVVLVQPGFLLISVAYVSTSSHRRDSSHSLSIRELVLPLYGPGRTATNSLASCSTMRAGPTPPYHPQGEAGLDPWYHPGPHPGFWVGTLQYISPLWPTILHAGTSPPEP